MNDNLLILIDGSSYLYRAYHAMPGLTSKQGEPTGAIYGVLNMLKSLINEYHPKYLAVVFDAKGKTFRHDMYKEYKAHRPPMPEDLRSQIEPLHDIIRAMHVPLLCVDGVEADDVIGTLAKQASKAGLKTLISTGDKDLAQLVDDDVTLINTMNNSKLDPQGVIDKFGVPADKIIDYLSLMGDTSDNIPGVTKCGPKTAVKWLDTYGSLDAVIKNADDIGGKVGENLREAMQWLPLSRDLVTIKCTVSLPYKIADLRPGEPDDEKLITLLSRYNFQKWLTEIKRHHKDDFSEQTNKQYHTILTQKTFDDLINQLKKADLFAFDTETTSLNYINAEIVGLSFSIKPHEAYYLPVAHNYENAPKQLDRDTVLKTLKPLLQDKNLKKVGQNLKYDREVLANYDIELNGIAFDTMLESYVYNSTASRHDMDSLALKYLGHSCIHYEDVAGKGVKQIGFNEVSLEKASEYAAEDADITLQLHDKLYPRLEKDKRLLTVFDTIEMPLISILSRMERLGVKIDVDALAKQSQTLEKRIDEIKKETFTIAGSEFNLSSPKQLQHILFEKLQLPVLKKTPGGQASTAEEVLRDLAHDFELPRLILEHRSLSKLKSTYTDRLPEQVNEKTGRVHTSYHQAVAGTGRLSSSNPNLQNIPTRTEAGRRIRQAFIPEPGYTMVSADYSQIELRIMAHLAKDKGLLDAFNQGLDVHKATAAEVFAVKLSDVTDEQRRRSKAVNFGLIYGMSAFGLAKQLGVERAAAQSYIDAYFEKYPGVLDYMETTRAQAHEKGYVETLFGRRLYLPDINARNKMLQRGAERAAINAPMQGTAADIIKRAMITVDHWIQKEKIDARMIMQVHDELVFEVKTGFVAQFKKAIAEKMSAAADLAVPLVVDVGHGKNWDEAH